MTTTPARGMLTRTEPASTSVPRPRRRREMGTGRLERAAMWVTALLLSLTSSNPLRLFTRTLPLAGDQGSQNWWLLTFRDRLFGLNGHHALNMLGWTQDFSGGMGFGYFYFPLPPMLFSLLSIVLPDAVSVKLVVQMAIISVLWGTWRLTRALTNSTVVRTASIVTTFYVMCVPVPKTLGGNLLSAMAGEFSYTLAFGLGLWLLARVVDHLDGRGRVVPTVMLAACVLLSHLHVAVLIAVCAATIVVVHLSRRPRLLSVFVVALCGPGLAAWWLLPAVALSGESMGNGRAQLTDVVDVLTNPLTLPLLTAGTLGLCWALLRRRDGALTLIALLAGMVLAFRFTPPVFWNARTMPLIWSFAGIGVAYLAGEMLALTRQRTVRTVAAATLGVLLLGGLFIDPVHARVTNSLTAQVRSLHKVNGGGATRPGGEVLRELASALQALPPGRLIIGRPEGAAQYYGTNELSGTFVLAAGGRLSSGTTLFAEASRTSPAFYLVSGAASDRQVSVITGRPSSSITNVAQLPTWMNTTGTRYVATANRRSQDAIEKLGVLRLRLTVGEIDPARPDLPTRWKVYELPDLAMVESLPTQPLNVPAGQNLRTKDGTEIAHTGDIIGRSYATLISDNPNVAGRPTVIVEGAHDFWQGKGHYPPVQVSDLEVSDERISFHVDTLNIPMLVKYSYSSRFTGDGTVDGPYLATPGFMVVVPLTHDVTLRFDHPVEERKGALVTLLSVLLLPVLGRVATRRRRTDEQDEHDDGPVVGADGFEPDDEPSDLIPTGAKQDSTGLHGSGPAETGASTGPLPGDEDDEPERQPGKDADPHGAPGREPGR